MNTGKSMGFDAKDIEKPRANSMEVEGDDVISLQFKIILLGDGAVGKTSIAKRFSDDQFNQNYKQTVGVDFFIRRITIGSKYEIALQIWDIGGQSIGSKMVTNYIAGAHAILLCYDITNSQSFENLEDWYGLVLRTFHKTNSRIPFTALVGNKQDLRHLTAVRIEQHNKFADENLMTSFLMSAKSGDQVKQAFHKIACSLAGVPLSKTDIDTQPNVISAAIIDHDRHDETVNEGKVPEYTKPNQKCIIS